MDAAALGLLVQCPHCTSTFVAIEEIEAVARPAPNPTLPPPEPRPRPRRRRSDEIEDEPPPAPQAELSDELDHDPHRVPPGGLPASVLIGLALLPFLIPILWLVAPALFGEEAVLSIATPTALAVSASVLCLAVIYTVDWSPATRVKGVLMLVSLAYFAGVTLYFLKKEMVDRVKKALKLDDGIKWQDFTPEEKHYKVKMPGRPRDAFPQEQPFPKVLKLKCHTATHVNPILGAYTFVAGSAEVRAKPNANGPEPGTDAWFELVVGEIEAQTKGKASQPVTVQHQGFPGREVEITLPNDGKVRVVRVFVIKGRVYYLSVEGVGMSATEDSAVEFFESFLVNNAKD